MDVRLTSEPAGRFTARKVGDLIGKGQPKGNAYAHRGLPGFTNPTQVITRTSVPQLSFANLYIRIKYSASHSPDPHPDRLDSMPPS